MLQWTGIAWRESWGITASGTGKKKHWKNYEEADEQKNREEMKNKSTQQSWSWQVRQFHLWNPHNKRCHSSHKLLFTHKSDNIYEISRPVIQGTTSKKVLIKKLIYYTWTKIFVLSLL